jgi:hypothetical protein
MAALTVSKMPVKEASAVIERLTGVKLPPATLDREARRQGKRADKKRAQLDEQMCAGQGGQQMLPLPQEPFTLVIELDAWNIRERDNWGQSATQRAAGQEPQRWHWVYGGTCFRLSQRSWRGEAELDMSGTVMTRGGVSNASSSSPKAQRHGLTGGQRLVVADGARDLNLSSDRFVQAPAIINITPASICGPWLTHCTRG